ncbi:unnamed protein product, partial [Citrullus colocynthis]
LALSFAIVVRSSKQSIVMISTGHRVSVVGHNWFCAIGSSFLELVRRFQASSISRSRLHPWSLLHCRTSSPTSAVYYVAAVGFFALSHIVAHVHGHCFTVAQSPLLPKA